MQYIVFIVWLIIMIFLILRIYMAHRALRSSLKKNMEGTASET